MKIGDEVYVHGFVDEIRKDIIIIKNDGGYFGTVPSEVINRRNRMKAEWTNKDVLTQSETTGLNSKAVLVIEMPQDCVYCPCWRVGSDEFPHDDCTAMQRPLTNEEEMKRPSWCPLRPLPEKRDVPEGGFITLAELAVGWNACIDEITGCEDIPIEYFESGGK